MLWALWAMFGALWGWLLVCDVAETSGWLPPSAGRPTTDVRAAIVSVDSGGRGGSLDHRFAPAVSTAPHLTRDRGREPCVPCPGVRGQSPRLTWRVMTARVVVVCVTSGARVGADAGCCNTPGNCRDLGCQTRQLCGKSRVVSVREWVALEVATFRQIPGGPEPLGLPRGVR